MKKSKKNLPIEDKTGGKVKKRCPDGVLDDGVEQEMLRRQVAHGTAATGAPTVQRAGEREPAGAGRRGEPVGGEEHCGETAGGKRAARRCRALRVYPTTGVYRPTVEPRHVSKEDSQPGAPLPRLLDFH